MDTDDSVAKALGKTIQFVQKERAKLAPPPPAVASHAEVSPVTGKPKITEPTQFEKSLARREGITIMTEAASVAADDMRDVNAAKMPHKLTKNIFRINPNKPSKWGS